MNSLRLAFFGTPDFAVPALKALAQAGHRILRVYTQPPRPAGRGQAEQPSPISRAATAMGIQIAHPATLKDPAIQSDFVALACDAAVVVAYGLILPKAILDGARLGCLNIHASLLPRWRGAAPIQRAILAGDKETGITIMRMDRGLDTGAMLLAEPVPITPGDTGGTLHDKLSALGARLIVTALDGLAAGTLVARSQPNEGVTYAAKIDKAETRLDWRKPAAELQRAVRAFAPAPGAWFEMGQDRVRVLQAEVAGAIGPPGALLDGGLIIACGKDALRLVTVQPAGKKPMPAEDFLRGRKIAPGTVLG